MQRIKLRSRDQAEIANEVAGIIGKSVRIEGSSLCYDIGDSAEVRKLHEAWNYRGDHYEATLTVNIHPLFLRRKAEIPG